MIAEGGSDSAGRLSRMCSVSFSTCFHYFVVVDEGVVVSEGEVTRHFSVG